MTTPEICKPPVLTKRINVELADTVGKLLLEELGKELVRAKVSGAVSTFVREKKLLVNAADLTQRLEWAVKVRLKSRT